MRYLEIDTEQSSHEPLPLWGRILQKILPAANPDTEKYYSQARIWWLEIDEEGKPQREIGFDSSGKPVVLGPVGDNVGFLVDSSDDWSDSNNDSSMAARDFEATWDTLWPIFRHLEEQDTREL